MKRGPKPKPTAIKLLTGNPGRRPIDRREPQPARLSSSRAPRWLGPEGRRAWAEVIESLSGVPGLLTQADRGIVALYAHAWEQFHAARVLIEKGGLVVPGAKGGEVLHPAARIQRCAAERIASLGAKLGLSPSDRVSLRATGSMDVDAGDAIDCLEKEIGLAI